MVRVRKQLSGDGGGGGRSGEDIFLHGDSVMINGLLNDSGGPGGNAFATVVRGPRRRRRSWPPMRGGEGRREPAAEIAPQKPTEDGLDLERQLREQDL
jgi:hypothetical protein